jgi:hypothetical protein
MVRSLIQSLPLKTLSTFDIYFKSNLFEKEINFMKI